MSIDRISVLADRGDLAFVELDCAACGSRTMSLVLRAASGAGEPVLDTAVHPELGPLVDARLAGRPAIGEDDVRRRRAPARRLGRRPPHAARGPSRRPAGAGGLTQAAGSERGAPAAPSFAHASEAELARILDFYEVRWAYEPDTFPIGWNLDGDVIESFSPDFYLPDLDLYVELTTLKQKLVRKKNRKLRRLRELYPDVRIKLFYARDFRALLLKFGRMALRRRAHRDDRPGDASARPPSRPRPGPRMRPPIPPSRRCWPSGRRTRSSPAELAAELVVPAALPAAAPVATPVAAVLVADGASGPVNGTGRGRRRGRRRRRPAG